MIAHDRERMPLYAAGLLAADEQAELEKHLAECADCRAELAFWRDLAGGIAASNASVAAPAGLAERTIQRLHAPSPFQRTFLRTFGLLRAQAYLVKREMWPASAVVMALGLIVALIIDQARVITFIAPLVAAACLAAIYGPENDPASELALATPTSPWKILLARLTLVSGYNLLLTLIASLALLVIIPAELLGSIILAWLGPLTFLSALALLLSLWIGTGNAVALSYGLWIVQFVRLPPMRESWVSWSIWEAFLAGYQQFWGSPALLAALAAVVIWLTLLSVQRLEPKLSHQMPQL